MSLDYRLEIGELQGQAASLGQTPVRLALEEEAVRLADSHNDISLGFELRQQLIETATFCGHPEKSLVAFTWMLAQADRDPLRFPESGLLWKYKWVSASLDRFPQITLQQMEDAFADMEARYRRCGLSLKPLWKERAGRALGRGDLATAREYYQRWSRTRGDYGSDCAACDRSFQVNYLIQTGRVAQGIKCAQPLVDGHARCACVPHETLADLLLPLVQRGNVEAALAHHRAGYQLVRGNGNFLTPLAQHLTYLTVTGDYSKAIHLLEAHLSLALDTMELSRQFDFYLAAQFLCKQMSAATRSTVRLRLARSFPLHREEDRYETVALAEWFAEQCRALATRFDARNGTDYFAHQLTWPDGNWKKLAATVDRSGENGQ